MTDIEGVIALRWTPPALVKGTPDDYIPPLTHQEVWTETLNKCVDHRPWFSDEQWEAGELYRRQFCGGYISQAWFNNGLVWDAFKGEDLVGVILLNALRHGIDASFHAVFFDHRLRSKQAILINALDRAFQEGNLQIVRVEIPDYAAKLEGFLRKALGFRYEAEWLGTDPQLAKRASIQHRRTLYNAKWSDGHLLSLTREHFYNEVVPPRKTDDDRSDTAGVPSGVGGAVLPDPASTGSDSG